MKMLIALNASGGQNMKEMYTGTVKHVSYARNDKRHC